MYAAGSDGRAHAGFPKKNSGPAPEGFLYQRVLGPVTAIVESHNGLTIFIKGVRVTPRRRFAFFFRRGEKGSGRAFDFLFSKIAFFLRGRPAIPVFFWFGLRATPFLGDKKGGRTVRGFAPEPRVALVDFLSMKIDSGRRHPNRPI